jgi:hypothetical protein
VNDYRDHEAVSLAELVRSGQTTGEELLYLIGVQLGVSLGSDGLLCLAVQREQVASSWHRLQPM